jgi:peptidoglycan/xylan/chitin deacetylase (PgdA/CDA1 family)
MRRLLSLCLLLLLFTLPAGPGRAADPAPALAGDGTLRRIRVPILMYHYISVPPPDADVYRVDLSVTPTRFREHVAYLAREGYSTTSLVALDDALMWGRPLPPNPVILTFDDGHLDHYTQAFPILREQQMTGTFFIITGFADRNERGYMSWEQIKAMADAGMAMESHTKTHMDLRGRDEAFLVYQIMGSRESLLAHTGRASRVFCYPGGRYDAATLALLRTTDVLRAVTTQHGALHTTDNRYELPRLRVSYETGVAGLSSLLNTRD